MASDKQIIGMAGVYLVAAELCLRNFIVSVTSRSAKGVDLLASTRDCKKVFSIQVKTNGDNRDWWFVDKESTHSPTLIYIFVRIKKNAKPDFYIVKSSEVARDAYHEKYGKEVWHSSVPKEKHKDNWGMLR
ncbi:MAG: hypothetical protein AB1468_03100 [Candidatus Micrarchaeota archaeon]